MSNETKFGEQNWSEVKINTGEKEKVEFMRLKAGNNIVRVLTKPFQYYQHRWEPKGGKQYGYRINCSDTQNHKDCPMCELGDKATRKWLVGVIDRDMNMWKVLDIPFTVMTALQNLQNDEDWGDDLQTYDINILNNPSAGAKRYSVVSKPKKPLTASDLQIKEERGTAVLVQRSDPPTRESVQGYFDHILEELKEGGNPFDVTASDSGKSDDEEGDTFFKDYDKK